MFLRRLLLALLSAGAAIGADVAHAQTRSKEASQDDEASAVLTKLLETNASWIDPKPQQLSYVLTAKLKPDKTCINRVWIDGPNARWEMDGAMHVGGTEIPLDYALVINDGHEGYSRGPEKLLGPRRPQRDIRNLMQGITWATAIHAIQRTGVPTDAQVIDRNDKRVVVEMDLPDQKINVGLGLFHQHFGQARMPIGRVRLHIDLPEHRLALEELVDRDVRIEYGTDQIVIANYRAPASITFVRKQPNQTWELEARFKNSEEQWLLDRAFNRQDGNTVAELVLSDVSTKPVDQALFALP